MNEQPLVSVVTASYNMGQYVCLAVNSVLNQDYPNIEIIVVNDGSSDDTRERLTMFDDDDRVNVIHQQNMGQTVAKNRGLEASKGKFVGFCDADNFWLPGKLSRQVPLLDSRPEVGVVYGDIALIDEHGNPLSPPNVKRFSGRITPELLVKNFVTFNTTLVYRDILENVGGFDEGLSMAIDYDLWLRISLNHEFLYLDQPLVGYRIWEGQMSHRTGERLDNAFRMMEKFLAKNPGAVTPAQARRAWAYSLTSRGLWHSKEGRKSQAMSDYQAAISKSPLDIRAWKKLTRLLLGI